MCVFIHCLNKLWHKVGVPVPIEAMKCILVRMTDVLVFWLGRIF